MFALPKTNSKSDSTFSTYVTVYDLCPRPARSWARLGTALTITVCTVRAHILILVKKVSEANGGWGVDAVK